MFVVGVLIVPTAYLYWHVLRSDSLIPNSAPLDAAQRATAEAMLAGMLATFCLVLAFLVGSYLMVKLGRAAIDTSPTTRTKYVDAWKRYRLTDDQIASAGQDLDDAGAGPLPPEER
jgi:hypothetical protein